MKSIRNLLWPTLLAAGAALTAAAGISTATAADEATAPPAAPAQGWHHHRGPWHLLSKLNLSAAQKQQIKDIMATARSADAEHSPADARELAETAADRADRPELHQHCLAGGPGQRLAGRADLDRSAQRCGRRCSRC